jgi:hypothetical protein
MRSRTDKEHLQKLLRICETEKQRQIVEAMVEHGTQRLAAEATGISAGTICSAIRVLNKRLALKDASDHYENPTEVPDPYLLAGVSTYYKADPVTGRPAFWAKTKLSREQFQELLKHQADLYFATLPKIKSPKFEYTSYQKDIIPWFQIGDAHLGMLAHHSETLGNFDVKIATTEMMAAFKILFDECQPGERCVINDLGDFTHYENYAGTTEASGHSLDLDGRFPKMIDCYIPLMRFIVESALKKFKHVDIIINQGNHSRTNDVWMARLLMTVYKDDKRVHVLKNSNVFIPYRMGNTFVMTHHSDKCKPEKLAKVMATDYSKDWGESTFRYIDTGHVHHSFTSKEHPGVLIESWNNLAQRDKYAHEGGWRSRQSITRLDRSRTYGNVSRRVLSIEEIRDRIRAGLADKKPGYCEQKTTKVYTV